MFTDRFDLRSFAVCALCFSFPAAAGSVQADDAATYRTLAKEHAPALVTVKFLLRMESQYGKRESENEITGIMIDPKGLILCANSRLGGARRGGSVTPLDMKILIGDDIEGIPAKVLARDTELDLAWVKIKDPGDRTFQFIDLSKSAQPQVGDKILALRRMAKFFDRTPVVSDGRIAGHARKPRELLIPSGLTLEPGQPVFAENGKLVGVVVLQLPEDDEIEANPTAFMAMRQDILSGLILPTAQIASATERAKLSTEEDEDDEEDENDGTPDAPSKPASNDDEDD